MAEVTKAIHIGVVTYDPAQDQLIPVPDAEILIEDDGWFYDPNISSGNDTTDAGGTAAVDITYDEADENSLNPYFTFSIPGGSRTLPPGATADKQITVPDKWVTQHDVKRRVPRITDHTDPNNALQLFVGMPAQLRVAYTDFHPSGLRNPLPIPQETARLYLSDYDTFLWIDFLNPDDTLAGFGYDPTTDKTVAVGDKDQYPYFNEWPTMPNARDGLPTAPRAWLDPPEAPVGTLGGRSFGATGPIAVDLHGFVFMIDGNVVHRFYPDGTYCQTIPEPSSAITLNGPKGLAVDQFRNLFVADSGNDQILIFQPQWLDGRSGRYQHVQTVAGHGLDEPRGMAVVPNRVVEGAELLAVVDGNNDRVQVFTIAITGSDATLAQRAQTNDTITLTHLVNFGSTGNNPGEFTDPIDVAADRAQRLFVVDRALHRVSRWTLNPAGTAYSHDVDWEKAGGGSGSGNREFDTPEAIAVDWKNHYAYVAEAGNHRVQRLDADSGNHLGHWGDPHAPALANPYVPIGVAVDSRGEIYVADRDNIRVVRGTTYNAAGADQGGNTAPTVVGSAWTPHSEPTHMVEPVYTLFTPDGRLWVSDTGNNRVLLYERNAARELALVTPVPPLAGLDRPTGLAVDANGDLYVVDRGNDRVRRYDNTFAHQADFGSTGSGANEFDNPRGAVLIQRMEKRLYVADRDNDRVQVIKLDDGSFLPQIDQGDPAKPGGGTPFDKPEDVAVDSKGNLYIADTGNRRIVQFDANDAYVREIKLTDPALRFQEPCGLAVDHDDKLLVTDRGLHTVFLIEADGDIVAFWDLKALARMRTLSATEAPKKGDVTFAGGLTVKPYTEIYSKEAQIVTTAGVLTFTPKDGSAPTPHNLNVGDLVFAKAGKRVGEDDLLFARLVETEYFPELSRHLKFDGPSRAVIDERGLLAVADTNNHRVRLVRTATTLKLNLLDLGEQLPDISFRAVTEADWREALGLEVKIAKVPLDGAAIVLRNIPVLRVFLGGLSTMSFARNDFITEPEKNFSDDQYRENYQLGNRNLVSAAINTLKVMYTVQRWLHHLSREDEADHRWGNPARKRTLKVDLLRKPGSYHAWFAENINLGSDETGRGGDSWDDSVIVHEMHHWIFDKSVQPFPPFGLGGGDHSHSQITSQTLAILEGYAEYAELFWGGEYGGMDRVRGFRLAAAGVLSGSLTTVREYDGDTLKNTLYLAGGVSSGAAPTFDAPQKGLEVEGYFANTLWQIHHALAEPNILFADAPTFWHCHNSFLTQEQSRRFSAILRKAMRNFPELGLFDDRRKKGSEMYLKQVLQAAHDDASGFAQLVQSIYELNNQLLPVLTITRGTSSTAPGSALADNVDLNETDTIAFIVQLKDAVDQPLVGYNVHFAVTTAGDYTVTAGGPFRRGATPGTGLNAVTNNSGIVNLSFEAPPGSGGRTETMTVSYQPDFDTDRTFDPPTRGDDQETTLRKLYLYELRTAAKSWPNSGNNFGARISRTITMNIQTP